MIHVDYPPEAQALWDAVEEEYRSRKRTHQEIQKRSDPLKSRSGKRPAFRDRPRVRPDLGSYHGAVTTSNRVWSFTIAAETSARLTGSRSQAHRDATGVKSSTAKSNS